jgi:hypothetical protein
MSLKFIEPRFAWLPVTPRGVAAYARTSFGRLLVVQLLVAVLSGVVVLWFCQTAWFPVIRQAIKALPAGGEIGDGQLHWKADSPMVLASGSFLSVAVNLDGASRAGEPAHLRIECGATNLSVCSLLGCLVMPYPAQGTIAFERAELEPWWGAREPYLKVGLLCAVVAVVWLSWQILSFLYLLPVWLAGVLAQRELSLAAAFRMGGAAVLPGAFVMLVTIVLYGSGWLDVIRLMFGAALHFVVGWVYLVAAIFFLPRPQMVQSENGNPFDQASSETTNTGGKNPFGDRAGRAP